MLLRASQTRPQSRIGLDAKMGDIFTFIYKHFLALMAWRRVLPRTAARAAGQHEALRPTLPQNPENKVLLTEITAQIALVAQRQFLYLCHRLPDIFQHRPLA